MSLSYSCNLFEQFNTALHWIAMNKLGVYDCVHVLDDFLFVAPVPIGLCMADLAKFLEIAKTLGVPLEKKCSSYYMYNLFGSRVGLLTNGN